MALERLKGLQPYPPIFPKHDPHSQQPELRGQQKDDAYVIWSATKWEQRWCALEDFQLRILQLWLNTEVAKIIGNSRIGPNSGGIQKAMPDCPFGSHPSHCFVNILKGCFCILTVEPIVPCFCVRVTNRDSIEWPKQAQMAILEGT